MESLEPLKFDEEMAKYNWQNQVPECNPTTTTTTTTTATIATKTTTTASMSRPPQIEYVSGNRS